MTTAGKPITCKAAVAWEPKKPVTIETIEVAPPKAGEVRIKVYANGVCHSDLSVLDGKAWDPRVQWPVILGHEGAGVVESIGEGVTRVQPGDHVIPLYMPQCDECDNCKSSKTNICSKLRNTQAIGVMPDGTPRFTCNGKPVYHFMGTSTFSEYTVVADISVCKIDQEAPLEKVCLIGCGISTGYGAALNTAKVDEGSTCAVWGLGAVGLATVMGCKAAGAKRIIAVDINPEKEELAKTFGATEFVNPADYDKPIEAVIGMKTKGGCDFTFECIGLIPTIRAAFYSCREGWGKATIVGVVPAGHEVSVAPMAFNVGRTLTGTVFGGWKGMEGVPKLVDLYMKKELLVDEFVTQNIGLDKLNDALDLLRAGKGIRSVIIY